MKRHTFWIAVIIALLLVPALMFVCKKTIVPNTAMGQDKKAMVLFDASQLTFQGTQTYRIYTEDTIKVIFGDKEYETTYPIQMFMGLLAIYNELKLYSAECYADSTAWYGEVYRPWESAELDTMYPPSSAFAQVAGSTGEIVKTWFHKKPTLPGFMEFLEGKYK